MIEFNYPQTPIIFAKWIDIPNIDSSENDKYSYGDNFNEYFSFENIVLHDEQDSRPYKNEDPPSSLNILVICDSDGYVNFYAFGCVFICEINIKGQLIEKYQDIAVEESTIDILGLQITNDSKTLLVVVNISNNESGERVVQLCFDISLFNSKNNEICYLSWEFSRVNVLLSALENNICYLRSIWEESLNNYEEKMKQLESELESNNTSLEQALMFRLIHGKSETAIENFLDHTLKLSGIKTLISKFNQTFEIIEDVTTTSIKYIGEMLLHKLGHINGLLKWKENFNDIIEETDDVKMEDIIQTSCDILSTYEQFILATSIKKRYISNFLNWLLRLIIDSDEEYNGEVVPKYDETVISEYLKGNIFYDEIIDLIDGDIEENDALGDNFIPDDLLLLKPYQKQSFLSVLNNLNQKKDVLYHLLMESLSRNCTLKSMLIILTNTNNEEFNLNGFNLFRVEGNHFTQFDHNNTSWFVRTTFEENEPCFSVSCFDLTYPEDEYIVCLRHYKDWNMICLTSNNNDEKKGSIQTLSIESLEYFDLKLDEVNSCNGVLNYFEEIVMMHPFECDNGTLLIKSRIYDKYPNSIIFVSGNRGLSSIIHSSRLVVLLDMENDDEVEEEEDEENELENEEDDVGENEEVEGSENEIED